MPSDTRSFLSSPKRQHVLILLLFAAICSSILVAFYYPLIIERCCFYVSDHCYYFQPFTHFIGEAYRNFRLPLWNPYVYSGMPQLAVPSPGIFYPFNLIWAFTGYGQGLGLILTLHQLIAGMGAFLLVNRLGWGLGPAFFAGSTCAFCGYMFSMHTNHTLVTSAAWIPISGWSLLEIKLARERRHLYGHVFSAAIFISFLIIAGRPEVSAAGLGILLMFSLLQSCLVRLGKNESDNQTNFAWQVVAFATAALLSMPLILPTLEWLGLSTRAKGMDVKYVFLWSANWYDLLSSIFAQPFGDLQTLGSPFLDVAASRAHFLPFLASPLIGPVVLTLAVWSWFDSQWRGRLWIISLTVIMLLFIIGENTIFIPKIVAFFPVATLLRYPIKLTVLVSFLFALMAARGLAFASSKQLSLRLWRLTLILWVVSLFIGMIIFDAGLFDVPIPFPVLAGNAQAQILIGVAVILGSLGGLATVACASLLRKANSHPLIGLILMNLLVILSLTIPAFVYRPRVAPRDFFQARPYVLRRLQQLGWNADTNRASRILVLYTEPVQEPESYRWKANSTFNQNYYQYTRELLLPLNNLSVAVPEGFGYEAASTADYYDTVWHFIDLARSQMAQDSTSNENEDKKTADDDENFRKVLPLYQFCRSSATGFVTTQIFDGRKDLKTLDQDLFDLIEENRQMNVRIYRVRRQLPRIRIAKNWHWMDKHEDVIRTINAPNLTHFDPIGPVVERLPKEGPSYSVPLPPGYMIGTPSDKPENVDLNLDKNGIWTQAGYITPALKAPASVSNVQEPIIMRETPEHIAISVNQPYPGFLILADHYYPGWKATIDGIEAPIFRANAFFRAVYLPKGGHLVEFDYLPDSLIFGAWGAAIGASIELLLLLGIFGSGIVRIFRRMAGQNS
jgi:hypothetical protein